MTKEDLEIYLQTCWRARIKFYASPETLEKIDQMEVKALALFHNPSNWQLPD